MSQMLRFSDNMTNIILENIFKFFYTSAQLKNVLDFYFTKILFKKKEPLKLMAIKNILKF